MAVEDAGFLQMGCGVGKCHEESGDASSIPVTASSASIMAFALAIRAMNAMILLETVAVTTFPRLHRHSRSA